jgi:hypothetical protein
MEKAVQIVSNQALHNIVLEITWPDISFENLHHYGKLSPS